MTTRATAETGNEGLTPHDTRYLFVLPFSTDPDLARRFLARDSEMVGNIRFGKLLETLDKVAENTALAYVHRFYPDARVVTAAVDSIVLRNPADTRHDLVFSAQLNHVGKSSMEVGIRVECLGAGSSHLATCYFTMVARSTDSGEARSLVLPPLKYEQEVDVKRYRKAEQRRQAYRDGLAKAEEMPSLDEYLLPQKTAQGAGVGRFLRAARQGSGAGIHLPCLSRAGECAQDHLRRLPHPQGL